MFENPLILLGGNPLFLGMLNREKFHAKEIIVFDWSEDPPVKGDLHIQCDIKDSERILDWLEKNHVKQIRGALTMTDVGVPTQRKIHERYGFLVPTEQSITDAMIKGRAQSIWRKAGLLTRFSKTFESIPPIDQLPDKDLIVKPNFSNGSNGITIIRKDSRDEFKSAFDLAQKISWEHKVIVEEFIETRGGQATEFVVDMLGDSFGNVEVWGIAKKYNSKFNPHNGIGVKNHYNPADVSDSTLEKIANRAVELYKAIGVHTSFGDMDLILDSSGEIHPLDFGTRTSGFIGSDLLDEINPPRIFVNEYLDVIRGKRIGNGYTARKELSSIYFFYDLGDCIIKHESNLMEFLPSTIKNLYYDRSALKIGNHLRIPIKDVERSGFEIMCGARKDLTIETIIDAEERFAKFVTE
ncbi:MAG: ATP-grasp domain-containing protein [Selenomonadaceae bacterium]|nr:ATP-grasp domain-containing protein [Selenomonadaceae bacterium]